MFVFGLLLGSFPDGNGILLTEGSLMKKRIRKISALLLAAVLLLGGISFPGAELIKNLSAYAAAIVKTGTCGDTLTYTLDSAGLLTISGSGKMPDYYSYSSPSPIASCTFPFQYVYDDGANSEQSHGQNLLLWQP